MVLAEPELSIGVCAYNEANNISHLIRLILKEVQDCELIVVASGCTDGTDNMVGNIAARDSRVRLFVEQERNGKASAINRILESAKGKNIMFISADTLPEIGSIAKLTKVVNEEKVGLASARVVPVSHFNNHVEKTSIFLWHLHDTLQEILNENGCMRHASEMFCVRRDAITPLPPDIVNDDSFMAITVRNKGLSLRYVSEAEVKTVTPKTAGEYLSQRRRIIYGHFEVKRFTGISPQYFLYLLFEQPKLALRSIVMALAKKFDPGALLSLFVLEIVACFLGISDTVFKRSHRLWEHLGSTKVPISER